MKTKRFVSTLLALLLVCSLPVSAFAMGDIDPEENGGTIDETDTVTNNYGSVDTNLGTVENNYKTVTDNYGTVTTNGNEATKYDAKVNNNYGTVTTNNGTVFENGTETNHDKAIVGTNNFYVEYNCGTVTDNYDLVYLNHGTVTNNNKNVTTNNGTVTNNNEGGTVHHNHGGTVDTNDGRVAHNGGPNIKGTINTNNGTVDNNNNGTVGTNEITGTVRVNLDTLNTNKGTVDANCGTVGTNEITGTVKNDNYGNTYGTVGTNYGTVTEADGTTRYGVQAEGEDNSVPPQKENGVDMDLTQFFNKAGYVLTGFIQNYGMVNGKVTLLPSPTTVEGTMYTADCPNVLTLIWQAIINPGSGEITAAASDGTGSFGPGSVISINGHKFLLVAVVEDVYCLASVDSFEDEALSDLPALLASLLTEEQLTHVTGEPELLDEELTARFFAGEGSHIVFPCDSSLIFS